MGCAICLGLQAAVGRADAACFKAADALRANKSDLSPSVIAALKEEERLAKLIRARAEYDLAHHRRKEHQDTQRR